MTFSRRFLIALAASCVAVVALTGPAFANAISAAGGHPNVAWIQTEPDHNPGSTRTSSRFVVPTNSTSVTSTTISNAAPNGSSTTATARMATQANAVTDEGSETNAAGRYVFIGICAVIAIGAVSLFLKYRKKPTQG